MTPVNVRGAVEIYRPPQLLHPTFDANLRQGAVEIYLDRRGLAHPTFDANLRLGAVEIYLDRRGLSLS
jgi:hypothetical protein